MRKYLFKNKLGLFITILLKAISGVMFVFVAIMLQKIVDSATKGDMITFRRIVIFSIIYFVIMSIVEYLAGVRQATFIKNIITKLRNDIFNGVISKDHRSFYNCNTGDYISNLSNDINLIEKNYIVAILEMNTEIFKFIATIIVLIYINIWVTLALIVAGIVMFIIPYTFSKKIEHRNNAVSSTLGFFTKQIKDILGGYEVIKSYNIESSISNEFNKYNKRLEKVKFNQAHLSAIVNAVSLFIFIICQLSGITVAGYFVLLGKLSVGNLLAVMQLGNGVFGPIRSISNYYTMIRGMKGINNKVLEIKNSINNEKQDKIIQSFNNEIMLNNLTFSYDERKKTIDNITYKFKKNKKYVIVGESGCGKTTLIKLISGYYDNYDGEIIFDDNEIKNLNKSSIARLVSIIHQNVYMFDKTLKYNICLSKEFSKTKVDNSLQISGVDKFINSLDKGLDSAIGENGLNLSGGQTQRIAIARALIQGTPVLILDEGTSALDAQTAYDIENILLGIDNLTVIAVTHKLNEDILKKYDEIIFMDRGIIAENGSFDELINNKSTFYNFYKIDSSKISEDNISCVTTST